MTHLPNDGESREEDAAQVLTSEVEISGTPFPFFEVNFTSRYYSQLSRVLTLVTNCSQPDFRLRSCPH